MSEQTWTVRSWAKADKSRLYLNEGKENRGYLDTLTGKVESNLDRDAFIARLSQCLGISTTPPKSEKDSARVPGAPASVPLFPLKVDTLDGQQAGETLLSLRTQESYRLGIVGEQRTAGVLANMPGWRCLHSIHLSPKKDLDHLVIGPGGVLALDTKATRYLVRLDSSGTVRVNGAPKPWMEDVLATDTLVRRALSERLGVEQLPMASWLVVWAETGVEENRALMDGWRIRERILGLPQVLSQEDQETIYQAARLRSTWS